MSHLALVLGLMAAGALAAVRSVSAQSGKAASVADRKEAAQIYKAVCVSCHGDKGRGDGALAATLDPKPADFSGPEWQQKIKDADIDRIIIEGGVAVGKSPMMPPNPYLKGKPGVVAALRELVRGFAQKPPSDTL